MTESLLNMSRFKSKCNYIRVLEVSRRADHPFAGSGRHLLDSSGEFNSPERFPILKLSCSKKVYLLEMTVAHIPLLVLVLLLVDFASVFGNGKIDAVVDEEEDYGCQGFPCEWVSPPPHVNPCGPNGYCHPEPTPHSKSKGAATPQPPPAAIDTPTPSPLVSQNDPWADSPSDFAAP